MTLDHPFVKRVGRILLILLLLHVLVEVTGHHYLYNTLGNTIFKGKLGPEIQEYKDMPNRIIATGDPQPWPLSENFGSHQLTPEQIAYHELYQSVSFVVIHKDSLLFEQYWADFNDTSKSNSFSMAKSIMGLLTGIAIDRGEIKSVKTPVYHYLPQYEVELGSQLTIEHLLTMSAGINFDEHYLNPFAFPAKANYGDNLELLLKDYSVTTQPGDSFSYQSGTSQVLAFTLKSATRSSLAVYASEHVWKKVGAEHVAYWSLDDEDGTEKAFCCINATAKDFARIGSIYLHDGMWKDQRIVDSAYVAASVKAPGSKVQHPSEIYGYQWWRGEHAGKLIFFMRGIKGQYVLVMPDEDLIVVRMGRTRHEQEGRAHPEDVYNYLDMALNMINDEK